jgi:oligosaccharide repeat unit polymerase
MCISYLSAVFCAITGNYFFDYYPISNRVCILLSLSVFLFWISGLFISAKHNTTIIYTPKDDINFMESTFFLILFFVLFIALLFSLKTSTLGSEKFEEGYSRGIDAHLRNILAVFFAYCLCFKKNTFYSILIKVISFILIFLSGTKYHILFPFLVWFIYFLYKSKSIKKLLYLGLYVVIALFFIFSLNYFFSIGDLFLSEGDFFMFTFNHFLKYISGGFISFSEILKLNYVDIGFFHNKILPYNPFISISSTNSEESNVYSFIGDFLLSYGYLWSYLLIFILGVIFNYIYVSLLKSANKYFFIAYGFLIAAPMLLSFFANYYALLNIWEYAIFSCLLPIFTKKNYYLFFIHK